VLLGPLRSYGNDGAELRIRPDRNLGSDRNSGSEIRNLLFPLPLIKTGWMCIMPEGHAVFKGFIGPEASSRDGQDGRGSKQPWYVISSQPEPTP
jgi:hypothetical protein